MEEKKEEKVGIKVIQAYLETARSVFSLPVQKEDLEKADLTKIYNIIFCLTSITIIHSYAAIEAFCNYYLFKIREKVTRDPDMDPKAREFFDKYLADPKDFNDLLWEETKEKIKVLCQVYNIRQVHEAIPKAWQDFVDTTRKVRNFFVHPTPEVFEKKIEDVFTKVEAGKYVGAAGQIIEHFYKELDKDAPEWIMKNTLFEFEGIKLLFRES